MGKLIFHCPVCNKQTELLSEHKVAGLIYKRFACGHSQGRKALAVDDFSDYTSLDGKKPYKFQIVGGTFALNSNGRFLIMDEMGLGKTVQACMFLSKTVHNGRRFLWLCKSGLKIQAMREIRRWNGEDWITQILQSEEDFLLPVKGFILSFDMLWRFKDIEAFIKRANIDIIILDEVQHIKNSSSKRTQGVREAVRASSYVGGLSGTPIKNDAGEFFPILNMLRPDLFPSRIVFDQVWVQTYWDGRKLKTGGFKDPARFKNYTKDFIIRRTRQEVLPDLPTVSRNNYFSELGPVVEEAYKEEYKKFQDYYNYGGVGDSAFVRSSNILAYLTKMRHLTGIAKINPVVDYIKDFLSDTDRKLTIFLHHKDVAQTLRAKLEQEGINPLMLSADLSGEARQYVIDRFQLPENRILIASTLASGEGLNLQFCSDCVMMERQWNPANEEQAEARFIRIGQLSDKVTAAYFVAVGTVDEFFAKIVEKKRAISANALDGQELKWDESSLIKELAEVLAQSGGKQWGW